MSQLVDQLDVSRSVVERRFRKWLGHSPQQEIRRTQIRRVKELLRDTNLTLAKIASLTGFEHTEYMTVVFKRFTGDPPSAYRQRVAGDCRRHYQQTVHRRELLCNHNDALINAGRELLRSGKNSRDRFFVILKRLQKAFSLRTIVGCHSYTVVRMGARLQLVDNVSYG
ncbi:helix-turn-helix transcriptional regulator [Aeoliella mucimassa]|uniref:helix-turn-helix transcriptional regulator n=1 Tax=Aeoliella mucimassa TaxID=2527972 RepID=UPI0036F49957